MVPSCKIHLRFIHFSFPPPLLCSSFHHLSSGYCCSPAHSLSAFHSCPLHASCQGPPKNTNLVLSHLRLLNLGSPLATWQRPRVLVKAYRAPNSLDSSTTTIHYSSPGPMGSSHTGFSSFFLLPQRPLDMPPIACLPLCLLNSISSFFKIAAQLALPGRRTVWLKIRSNLLYVVIPPSLLLKLLHHNS